MNRLLFAVTLLLTSIPIHAAISEAPEMPGAPVEWVDMVFVVLFFVLLIGSIAWFGFHWWWKGKSNQQGK